MYVDQVSARPSVVRQVSFGQESGHQCRRLLYLSRTCCADALWEKNMFEYTNSYKEYLIASSKMSRHVDCKNFMHTDLSIPKYLMVTTCPPHYNKNVMKKCFEVNNNLDYILSVKGNDNDTYQNQYCATCNTCFVEILISQKQPGSLRVFHI